MCCQKLVIAQNFGTRSDPSAKTSASTEHYNFMFSAPLITRLRDISTCSESMRSVEDQMSQQCGPVLFPTVNMVCFYQPAFLLFARKPNEQLGEN